VRASRSGEVGCPAAAAPVNCPPHACQQPASPGPHASRLRHDDKRQLRESADELQALSPEERRWALDHPDEVRQLGELSPDQRKGLVDAYRNLPDELQEQIRDRFTGGR